MCLGAQRLAQVEPNNRQNADRAPRGHGGAGKYWQGGMGALGGIDAARDQLALEARAHVIDELKVERVAPAQLFEARA